MIYPKRLVRNIKRFLYIYQIELAAVVFLAIVIGLVDWFVRLHA